MGNLKVVLTVILGAVWCALQRSCAHWAPPNIFAYYIAASMNYVDAILCSAEDNLTMVRFFVKEAQAGKFRGLFRVTSQLTDKELYDKNHLAIFIDVSCPENQKLFTEKGNEWFTHKFTWMVWDEEDYISKVSLPLFSVSHVHKMNLSGIVRVYKSASTLPSVEYEEGSWGLESDNLLLTPLDITINMNQSTVIAAILFVQDIYDSNRFSEQIQDWTYKPGQDVGNRVAYFSMLYAAHLFNFKVKLKLYQQWGEKLENGTWTGMLGALQDGTADFTLSPMAITSLRKEVAYSLIPIMPFRMAAVFLQPKALGTYRALILELTPSVWAVYGIMAILVAAVLAATQKYYMTSNPDNWLALAIVQTIGIVANQGLSYVPQPTSSRIVCLFWLVVCLLVSTYYGAGTVTALLSESKPIITTLDQLLQSKITLSPPEAPFVRDKKVRVRGFGQLLADKMDGLKLYQLDEGVYSIMNGSAFLGEYYFVFEGINRLLKSNTICDLTVFTVGPKLDVVNHIRKDAHLREIFMRALLRSKEHGLMHNERQHWLAEKLLCSRVTEFIQVSLESVSIAFYLFFGGLILSIVILCMELFESTDGQTFASRLRMGGQNTKNR